MPFDSKEFPPADQKQDGLSDVAKRARARITWRITPYVFLLYIIAFLDRVNVSFAALEMTNDLGFTPEIIGFGAGIFFVGYLLLSVPGSILFEKGSARNWIARCMICWGTVATLMGFIYTAKQFYLLRLLLGVAEAGFFPGDTLFAANRPHGLPIGNLTSQFWANVYLNPLDHFVKRTLKCHGYVRYVDDFLLFSNDKASLHRPGECIGTPYGRSTGYKSYCNITGDIREP